MSKAIMVDSGCAMTDKQIEDNNLEFMGMKIVIDDKTFTENEDIKKDEFYKIIQSSEEFHTTHPSIGEIVENYKKLKEKGYTEVIDIHFSSKMSGLINTCHMAKEMIEGLNIKIIDTENVSIGANLVAIKCIELINSGKNYEEVLNLLPEIKKSSYMQFSVPTLKYLIKNGRIGKAQGLAGTLLNIKPILGVEDGFIAPIAKVRGLKKMYNTMVNNAIEFIKKRPHNVKVYITYGDEKNIEHMNTAFEMFNEELKKINIEPKEIIRGRLWPTIVCHSGPEVVGLAVYGEEKEII